jgi:hypothetical protein
MDVSDASYYIFNEKGNIGSQMGDTKKILIKEKTGLKLNVVCEMLCAWSNKEN